MAELFQHIIAILSNDSLSNFENLIIWMNLFGCLFASYYNFKASSIGIPSLRKAHFLIMGFAGIYLLGYLMLLLCDPNFLIWSSWFRGISIVVWPIVWTYPAFISIRVWKQLKMRVYEKSRLDD